MDIETGMDRIVASVISSLTGITTQETPVLGLIRFLSFTPRTPVSRWTAWFVANLGIAWGCGLALAHAEGAVLVLLYSVLGIALAKLITESVRRPHDTG